MSVVNILVKDIYASPYIGEDDIFKIAIKKIKDSRLPVSSNSCRIYKKSIDARKKDNIKLVYSVCVQCEVSEDFDTESLRAFSFSLLKSEELCIKYGSDSMRNRPLVVGFGPAGMFCALLLAEHGYKPVVIERGDDVDARQMKKKQFYDTHLLDSESNIQFGAGGAGTFSDGKLVTRINDPACSYVLRVLHELGAPEEILYKAKPHVGTDKLLSVVKNADERIKEYGGEIHYRTRLDYINFNSKGEVVSVNVSGGREIECGALVLCIGHSARDTYKMLCESGLMLIPKPFSVGVRIEHLRSDIDRAMYGDEALSEILGPAEYNLSHNTKSRGVYTFCMCPGGEVVAATSEEGGVVVNGMSNYRRDGVNSNCAVAVSVFESDYGATVDGAINFQRHLERTAYNAGGGEYAAPVCVLGDFFEKRGSTSPTRVKPTYMEGTNFRLCDFSAFTPDFIYNSLRDGIAAFDKKLRGFASPTAVLSAFETRTSAPVRIIRNESRNAPCHDNLFPCGEGAGYAGGITSAAVDGLKTALEIMSRFAPLN